MIGPILVICVSTALSACNRGDKGNANAGTAGRTTGPFYASEHSLTNPSAHAVAAAGSPALRRTAVTNRRASARLTSTKGTELTGDAKLEESASGVLIHLTLKSGPPGKKAIHVHEEQRCADIQSTSVDRHFNPERTSHGLPENKPHHAGDLGNIQIGKDGDAMFDVLTDRGGLEPNNAESFLGRTLVIHEGEDNETQPDGSSGRVIACGVIEPS